MLNKEVYINRRKKLKENFRDGLILIMGNNFSPLDCEDNTYPFIKQCKNTRDSSTRSVSVVGDSDRLMILYRMEDKIVLQDWN